MRPIAVRYFLCIMRLLPRRPGSDFPDVDGRTEVSRLEVGPFSRSLYLDINAPTLVLRVYRNTRKYFRLKQIPAKKKPRPRDIFYRSFIISPVATPTRVMSRAVADIVIMTGSPETR